MNKPPLKLNNQDEAKYRQKFKTGLVVGKFYPPHHGHKYLIDTAIEQSQQVTVIVCYKPTEFIPGFLRAEWIKKIHPSVEVKLLLDDQLDDDDSEGWAKFTIDYLGFVPEAVFTSEDYGDPYAKFMGSTHIQVDKARTKYPISGTLVRNDPQKYLSYLEPCVQNYFIQPTAMPNGNSNPVKRIAIVGAESTGTTTLSKDLAKYYQTAWVPEYGRFYSEGKMTSKDGELWNSGEFEHIARMQNMMEDELAKVSNKVLICDTDAFATSVWHERYLGGRSQSVEKIANHSYDLYILTGDEIPWENDGTRDGEHIRHWMHERFIERLKENDANFITVTGSKLDRQAKAIKVIDELIK